MVSDVEEDRGLIGEDLLLNAEDGAVHLVVDVGQVTGGGALTDAAELIVDGTVAEADPALVGTEVGHGNAAQVGANGRAAEDGGVTGIRGGGLGILVEEGGGGQRIGEVDLGLGEATHEDHLSVPGGLEHLTWGQLRDVELLVGVTDVASTSNHLVVNNSDDRLQAKYVRGDNEALEHVGLGALDLVVSVIFVPESVLVEPVVELGLGVERIAEVGGTGRGHPEHVAVRAEQVVGKLLVLALVVLLHDAEVATGSG
jgi:hypothetical protein